WLSANLLAIRKGIIKEIPLDIAEDAVIPYLIWKKGYKVVYNEEAIIFVNFPKTLKEWYLQKTRSLKAHSHTKIYIPENIRSRGFFTEIKGAYKVITYPKNYREFIWTIFLFLVRIHLWIIYFYDTKIKKEEYRGVWKRAKTTSPLEHGNN
ncbi:MAG: hypothetical protein AABW81_01980, partial [Nanoarchaeota archaeon]